MFFRKWGQLNKKTAFTLAEVLITLGVIGIVAAMTIPTLINNTRDKQTIEKIKVNYSILSSAYMSATQENGPISDNWATDATTLFNSISPYLKIINDCGLNAGCFPKIYSMKGIFYDNWSGATPYKYKFQLINGTSVAINVDSPSCSTGGNANRCGWFAIDVNGPQTPNSLGLDIFLFEIDKDRLIPFGAANSPNESFSASCLYGSNTSSNGLACAAWAIYNNNLDYSRCSGLSWSGARACN